MAGRFRPRIDPSLSPAEREARIAELQAQRKARLRALGRRSVFTTVAIVLLLALAGWWLLETIAGRQFLLAQVVARLPAETSLTWARAEGPASGPLVLHDVHFYTPRQRDPDCKPAPDQPCAMGRIDFRAARVVLDPALRPLLGRRLRLDALDIQGARLDLPESDAPFRLPTWPGSLPEIAPPMALRADTIRIDGLVVTRAGAPVIDLGRVRGGLRAEDGFLHLERLVADSDRGRFTAHGDYAPREDYRSDLAVTAVLPARSGRTPARLGLVARGDLSAMELGLGGSAPGPVRATLALRGRDAPHWQLRAKADALDAGLLIDPSAAAGVPWALDLVAVGMGGEASLRGHASQGGFTATLLPSRVRVEDQVLEAKPVTLALLGGRLVLRGRADFNDPGNGRIRFAVNGRGLRWGEDPTSAVTADADLGLAGTLRRWALVGNATLARGDLEAQVRLDGRGHADGMTVRTLRAQMPTGTLDASGTVAWTPALGWDLDARLAGFDPGYFAPGWTGAVNGRLDSTGRRRADGGLQATVDLADLGGQLRGRPLDGHGRVAIDIPVAGTATYAGEVALRVGDSRVDATGRIGRDLDIDATLAPLHLADLLPDAAGTLRGQVQVKGARTAPDLSADLEGSGLRLGAYRADRLQLRGRLPWSGAPGTLHARADALQLGIALDTLAIEARGTLQDLQLQAQATGAPGRLVLAGQVGKRGTAWQGRVASLQLAPARGAQWRLQQPARFAWEAPRLQLDEACLASTAGGSLCAQADWPRNGLQVAGQGLPLSLFQPYLPARDDGRQWQLRGEIALDARLRPAGNAWQGEASLRSAGGGMKFNARARSELLTYQSLTLRTRFDPTQLQAELSTTINEDGRLDARVTTGWDAYAPLSGEIAVQTDGLTWMELLSPDIVDPRGQLAGRITLGGTRAQPALGGQTRLTAFTTELPALAITLTQGNLQLDAQADGSARIAGSVRSGEGVLRVDGSLGWRGDDTPLVLNLRGDNVLVSDTRDLRAVANPDLVVRKTMGQRLEVTGTVTVPEARIDLERLDRGVSASPDVVVLDPVDPEDDGIATALVMDLTLVVGRDVLLSGFGLDGRLGGQVRVRARPGREMLATGQLDVAGQYKAYGQELEITRGRLAWSNDPIGDPVINLRAEREVGAVTAGIDVTGRAAAPQAEVWSNPASSQSEALAYLTLGRPLSSLSGSERGDLNAASAALSAGGGLLASQLGARLGLDDAGVSQSRALGGSVLGIGKQLSPRLYVGYGVSLLGTGQVLTLKYLLDHGFDIEVESSSIENRASLNWRIER